MGWLWANLSWADEVPVVIGDSFLETKAACALDDYLRYLRPALRAITAGEVALGNAAEKRLLRRFGHENLRFQVRASTFVLEAFHTIELFLKASLMLHGEHLVYENLDAFLDKRSKVAANLEQQRSKNAELNKELGGLATAGKPAPPALMKRFMKSVVEAPVEDYGASVSARVALKRLTHFSRNALDAGTEERFLRLMAFRNQVIHFGDLRNLLRAVVEALSTLLSVGSIDSEHFPRFASLASKYASDLAKHAELMQHLMFAEASPRLAGAFAEAIRHFHPKRAESA